MTIQTLASQLAAAEIGPETFGAILRDARSLIADEHNWTQYALARNEAGTPTSIHGSDAVCWCIAGALRRSMADRAGITKQNRMAVLGLASSLILPADCEMFLDTFNDTHTHDEVLDAYDRAIETVAELAGLLTQVA